MQALLSPRDTKIKQTKKALIESLGRHKGIVSKACVEVGVDRGTFYQYWNNDDEFREKAADAQEIALDHVEGKLHELIDGVTMWDAERGIYTTAPNVTATIFYLKTKGKKRGYIERDTEQVNVNISFDPPALADNYRKWLSTQGFTPEEVEAIESGPLIVAGEVIDILPEGEKK